MCKVSKQVTKASLCTFKEATYQLRNVAYIENMRSLRLRNDSTKKSRVEGYFYPCVVNPKPVITSVFTPK